MAQFREQLDDDLVVLLARLTDGTLTAADRARLAARLAADPVAQERYLDFIDLHAMLAWEKGLPISQMPAKIRVSSIGIRALTRPENRGQESGVRDPKSVVSGQWSVEKGSPSTLSQLTTDNGQRTTSPIPHSAFRIPQSLQSRPLAFSLFVSTVATVVFLMLAAQIHVGSGKSGSSNPASPPLPFVAQLTAEKDCRWGERSEAVFSGAHLREGQILDLEQGLAEVAFRDGARTVIEGPAVFTLAGKNRGKLDRGKLTAHVEKRSAAGFTIHTPTATVVDLGTEFGIYVAENGDSVVQVLKGEVEVQSSDPQQPWASIDAPRVSLSANETVRVTAIDRRIAFLDKTDIRFPELPRLEPNLPLARKPNGVAIQFDLGNTAGLYQGGVSPAHWRGDLRDDLRHGDVTWNEIAADTATGLKFADGSDAEAIEADIGMSPSFDDKVDWNLMPNLGGPDSVAGLLDTDLGRDNFFWPEGRSLGIRVRGLPAGTYRVYFIARGVLPIDQLKEYRASIAVNVNKLRTKPTLIGPNVTPFSWIEGRNYVVETVTVAGPRDWIVAIQRADEWHSSSVMQGLQIVEVKTDVP